MVYYKPVKVMINISNLAKIIINVVIYYYKALKSIVTDQSLLFISKFWSLLCYFLTIKKKLFTAFYLQTDSQIEKQNNTIKTYFSAFIN